MLSLRSVCVAFVVSAVLTMSIATTAEVGVWAQGPPMADARDGHTATVLKDGRVLVVGLRAEVYDPAANHWSPTGALAIARTNQTATLLDDGRVLVAGGIDNLTGRSVPNAELYDPAANTWAAAGSMAGRRYDHTATRLRDGRVLVVGGTRSTVVLDSVEIYDPKTNVWSPAASLSTPRSAHTATMLRDGRVLVTGGSGSSATLASAELYDPAANSWSPIGPMAVPRRLSSATLLADGGVLVVGGLVSPFTQTGNATAEVFHPGTGTWRPAGFATQPLIGDAFAMTSLRDGRVLVCGGNQITVDRLAATVIYDPRVDSWSHTTDMAQGRVGHSASLLPNGRILVAGGRDAYVNGTPLNTTELFDPPPASSPVATSPRIAPTETVGSRIVTEPLVAGGIAVIAVIALLLITPPLLRRWRRRRGI